MNDKFSIGLVSRFEAIKPLDDRMTICKCYVMYAGKNKNHTCFELSAVKKALPSLCNVPIIAHLYKNEAGEYRVGGHDLTLEQTEDGKLYFKSVCVPYGVVPENCNPRFETVQEQDGTENEYLIVDVILWTGRFPELTEAVYSKAVYFNQSMEVNITSSYTAQEGENAGYLVIDEFQFDTLTLLGKYDDPTETVEPCFPMAQVKPYAFSLDDGFLKLLEEFKAGISACFGKRENTLEAGKGGKEKNMTKEQIEELLKTFGFTKEKLNFEITEEMQEEELKAKLEAYSAATGEGPISEPAEPEPQTPQTQCFGATYREKEESLRNAVSGLSSYTENEERSWYINDFDEKYVYVRLEQWSDNARNGTNYKIPYSITASNDVFLDLDNRKEVYLRWLTLEEKTRLETEARELKELRAFQAQTLEQRKREAYLSVVSEFSEELSGNEEFETIKSGLMEFNSEADIREKCFAIRGRTLVLPKKSNKTIKCPAGDGVTDPSADAFKAFVEKYKNK